MGVVTRYVASISVVAIGTLRLIKPEGLACLIWISALLGTRATVD